MFAKLIPPVSVSASKKGFDMRNIYIQFQEGGMWRNCMTLTEGASSQRILMDMQAAKNMYTDKRIRAVDHDGRLIDMLG